MRFVPLKSPEQLDLQALHRARSRLVTKRTAVINQIRGFLLKRGVPVRQGATALRSALPDLLATRSDVLSPRVLRLIEDLMADWRRLDARVESTTAEIEALVDQDEHCRRLMTAPGIGPITSSAMVAAIGTGDAFAKGRDFAAWLGLVPKQISTGDRTILAGITKRGNRYLRTLFIQGARSVLMRRQTWPNHGFRRVARSSFETDAFECFGGRPSCKTRPYSLEHARQAEIVCSKPLRACRMISSI
jgi:transposase